MDAGVYESLPREPAHLSDGYLVRNSWHMALQFSENRIPVSPIATRFLDGMNHDRVRDVFSCPRPWDSLASPDEFPRDSRKQESIEKDG